LAGLASFLQIRWRKEDRERKREREEIQMKNSLLSSLNKHRSVGGMWACSEILR